MKYLKVGSSVRNLFIFLKSMHPKGQNFGAFSTIFLKQTPNLNSIECFPDCFLFWFLFLFLFCFYFCFVLFCFLTRIGCWGQHSIFYSLGLMWVGCQSNWDCLTYLWFYHNKSLLTFCPQLELPLLFIAYVAISLSDMYTWRVWQMLFLAISTHLKRWLKLQRPVR